MIIRVSDEIRFVQITPPGSACSILVGSLSEMPPGSQKGIQVVIPDADEAAAHLRANGVECSDVDEQPFGRFVYFSDPDGKCLGAPATRRPEGLTRRVGA